MSANEEVRFLPYEEAILLVAAIQEEEHVLEANRRVLTVYNHDDKEICWFDFDEVLRDAAPISKAEEKEVVQDYILRHIPEWARDI
jgi:hypothetical protein